MASQEKLADFEQYYNRWKTIEWEKFYRNNLGSASFKGSEDKIQNLNDKIEKAFYIKNELGDKLIDEIITSIDGLITVIKSVIKYSDPDFIVNQLETELAIDYYLEDFKEWWPKISAVYGEKEKQQNNEALEDEIRKLATKSNNDAQIIEDLKNRLKSEIDAFENKYNEQFKRGEILNQQDVFIKHAILNRKQSLYWIIASIIAFIILFIALYNIYQNVCFDLNCFDNERIGNFKQICEDCSRVIFNVEIIKTIFYRLLILSLLIYIVKFTIKNYNACMHNYTVNTHKANSLSAALILIERAKTDAGNDNIMSQAATAIFSHQPTAYNNKNPENIKSTIADDILNKLNVKP